MSLLAMSSKWYSAKLWCKNYNLKWFETTSRSIIHIVFLYIPVRATQHSFYQLFILISILSAFAKYLFCRFWFYFFIVSKEISIALIHYTWYQASKLKEDCLKADGAEKHCIKSFKPLGGHRDTLQYSHRTFGSAV